MENEDANEVWVFMLPNKCNAGKIIKVVLLKMQMCKMSTFGESQM